MSELRIIPVTFGGERTTVTEYRIQHDWGQVYKFLDIDLPDVFEARFSNAPKGESVPQIGTDNMVEIPAQFFESGAPIYCYITLHDEETDGRTVYTVKTPISPSSDRTDAEPEPEEESIITQAITTINSAVTTTTQKAQEATESADRAEHAAEGVEGYAERAESAQQAAESARDRATQAETSARTSAATASEKASEASESASAASQSAIDAEQESERAKSFAESSAQSAEAARQFAINAGNSAYDASESAQEASGYASNASTFAQTASQKASEAAQSASIASARAIEADTAAGASIDAKNDAVTAQTAAQTAKTYAEDARDEAQEIVDGITGKVEQIDSNTDRIESLEDDRYKPYPTDSVSGSIASFPDGADNIPLKSCIVQIEPVQSGSGDPSPDNVRPITGWTGCEVQRTGKNLFNYNLSKATIGTTTAEAARAYYPLGFSNRTLSFSAELIDSENVTLSNINIGKLKDGKLTVLNSFITTSAIIDRTFTFSKDEQAVLITASESVNSIIFNFPKYRICVVTGTTPTPYEPYTGQTYPITSPTEAGTVYGGYVDITGGELVEDRAQIASYNGETLPSTWISDRDVYASGTTPTIGAQVVYKLAEPIHYPITPTEIKTLLGQNNLWADTGNVSVEYRADVTLYIERLTAPDSADMIADANIVSGQYFMVGNSLYKATANIANGGAIIVGTNCTRVSLATALNEINA